MNRSLFKKTDENDKSSVNMTITLALEMLLSFHDGMMHTYPKEVVVVNYLPSRQR